MTSKLKKSNNRTTSKKIHSKSNLSNSNLGFYFLFGILLCNSHKLCSWW